MKKLTILVFISLLGTFVSNAQWQPDVRLTYDLANSVTSTGTFSTRSIAANGNYLHIVWRDFRDGNNEIYYKRSTDGGTIWEADLRLTNDPFISINPSVTVFGSVIHVVWNDNRDGNNEIYYKHSTDGGVSWGDDTRLTNDPARSETPTLSVSGSDVHLVWDDVRDGNREIYYKRSTDGGSSWSGDIRLTNAVGNSYTPFVSVSGSVVHVVWNDNRITVGEIFYKRSTDGGLNWEDDTRLTNGPISFFPSISVSGSVVHITWMDTRDGNSEIYYKRSSDAGVSWGADTRLTNNAGSSRLPHVTVSGSAVHVVWLDNSDGNNEIYYKRSTDGGISWESDTRLTDNSFNSRNPSVSITGSVVHVLWDDNRDGNNEVYYKRNANGNPLPCQITVNAGNDTTIYYGYGLQQAVLIANGTGGTLPYSYLWSNGATTQSITVSPSSTTSYTVTVSDAASCNASDSITINVIDVRCGNNSNNVLICHNGKTLCISGNAIQAHLNHGDYLGYCGDNFIIENEFPEKFELSQNYPNPFNPVTNIKYSLPNKDYVKLSIYDLAGREATRLIDKEQEAGYYEISFDATNFASGVYFYIIETNEFTDVKKMVIIK